MSNRAQIRINRFEADRKLIDILAEHMDKPVPVSVHNPKPNENRRAQIVCLLDYGWIRHDHYRHLYYITPKGRETLGRVLGFWADTLTALEGRKIDAEFYRSVLEDIANYQPEPEEQETYDIRPKVTEEALARAFHEDSEIQKGARIADDTPW